MNGANVFWSAVGLVGKVGRAKSTDWAKSGVNLWHPKPTHASPHLDKELSNAYGRDCAAGWVRRDYPRTRAKRSGCTLAFRIHARMMLTNTGHML